ncbi:MULTISPECIES: hypothetical protein [Metabacillus]|uniref:Uncharacterized protein n=1 Tax=Metabacillus hrfriensis TaxID=3048891 RepID=A0ACD4RDI3_9BACI|nr:MULTISPECIES: hypothetical protein [Metabacillus]UAL53015.1 hypothetical protein K8L98_04185 [Metabacillus dongyingensis]UOK58598.1 hypothetical protein MGI18_05295 [Bacillus sp. OVS6]USK29336.1 hypothetical protein LIT32_04215 [Bacillus sp. CMF21]WHZ58556.1 hypothetical protein QLQ22_04205 [Metabacillus sp. CT-WN-B3]
MRKPTIYFLSYFNSCRSLIAEAWAKKLFSSKWQIESAGLVTSLADPACVKAMKEVNMFIEDLDSDKINLELIKNASVVVQMYDYKQEKTPPVEEGKNVFSWNLPNLSMYSFESDEEEFAHYQELCDDIAMRVKNLNEKVEGKTSNHTSFVM